MVIKGKVRGALWTGNSNDNDDDQGATNLTEMEVTITSKMTITMTTKTIREYESSDIFLELGVFQLPKSSTKDRQNILKLKKYHRWFYL